MDIEQHRIEKNKTDQIKIQQEIEMLEWAKYLLEYD